VFNGHIRAEAKISGRKKIVSYSICSLFSLKLLELGPVRATRTCSLLGIRRSSAGLGYSAFLSAFAHPDHDLVRRQ
jgi:hypothetical protein